MAVLFLKTSALDGVGGQRHAPSALPTRKTQYPLYRRLGGLQGRSGRMRKISLPPGFDPRTVQPVASRCTDYTIPVSADRSSKHSAEDEECVELHLRTPIFIRRLVLNLTQGHVCNDFFCHLMPYRMALYLRKVSIL
jgi:hypothetical protein